MLEPSSRSPAQWVPGTPRLHADVSTSPAAQVPDIGASLAESGVRGYSIFPPPSPFPGETARVPFTPVYRGNSPIQLVVTPRVGRVSPRIDRMTPRVDTTLRIDRITPRIATFTPNAYKTNEQVVPVTPGNTSKEPQAFSRSTPGPSDKETTRTRRSSRTLQQCSPDSVSTRDIQLFSGDDYFA